MNRLAKHILGTSLVLGLTAFSLCAQTAAQFGNLPLWFEAGTPDRFIAHGAASEFAVTPSGTEFTLTRAGGATASGRLELLGASPAARITGEQPLTGRINHLIGSDSSGWQTDVATFSKVRVENIYPGVNVVYYGNQQKLEYDFNLAAGVNPAVIALRFAGAEKLSVNPQGGLVIRFKTGEIVQHAPVAWQTVDGRRLEVAASYKILDPHTAMFALGDFNRQQPLVIDPVLTYSTYFGGNYGETAWAIAVNPTDGSIYVAGQTFSTKFTNNIPTSSAFQTNFLGGKLVGDAFVARFDSSGTNLIYVTYLGGNADDAAYALAVDQSGHAYVAGTTDSADFPTTNALVSGTFNGGHIAGSIDPHVGYYPFDAFVTELDTNGSQLIYSTYLGGQSSESAFGITLDSADNAFVTGLTYSTNFPVTPNAYQPRPACSNTFYINANAFVSEVAAGGGHLNYSTYLGGTNYDVGRGIACNNGRVFVAGYTFSTNFPSTNYLAGFDHLNGSTNISYNPGSDAFVTSFSVSGTNLTLLYSTLLGGSNYDVATGIAAGPDGSAYVAGYTTSTNFPDTVTNIPYLTAAFVHTNTTGFLLATNGFLTQIKWDGNQPVIGYSAMFGGLGRDVANGVALDGNGNAYVVGSASSTNFPATTNNISGFLTATNNSQANQYYSDAFIIAFNPDASALLYSAYLGGYLEDDGNAIAVDPLGNAYIAGQTLSANFPTVNALQTSRYGTNDMFIAKISQVLVPPAPALSISPQPANPPGITLQWQMFPANYGVESATALNASNWISLPASPVYSNGWYYLTLPATNDAEFFRLQQF